MREYNLYNYKVEIDENATTKWYATSDVWGCECADCRNFLKAVEMKKLPQHITETLNKLNILPEKATYVCELNTDANGVLYQFSYRIAGIIVDVPTNELIDEGHCCHETYPYGAPGFPEPHFDLEFFTILPWIL